MHQHSKTVRSVLKKKVFTFLHLNAAMELIVSIKSVLLNSQSKNFKTPKYHSVCLNHSLVFYVRLVMQMQLNEQPTFVSKDLCQQVKVSLHQVHVSLL